MFGVRQASSWFTSQQTQVCFSSSKRDVRYFTQGVPEATEPLLRVESHLFTVTKDQILPLSEKGSPASYVNWVHPIMGRAGL